MGPPLYDLIDVIILHEGFFLEYFVGLLLFMYKFYNIKCKLVSFTVAGMGCASSPWRSIIIIISLILGALLCD